MRYCGRYSNKINLSGFDEIALLYNGQDQQLLNFIQEHPNQEIITIIKEKDCEEFCAGVGIKLLEAIAQSFPQAHLALCLSEPKHFEALTQEKINLITTANIPVFVGDVATDFDELQYLLSKGVHQAYIGEALCFDLKRVKQLCALHQVKNRAFPNVGQCSAPESEDIKKFFIRPEDVEFYSQYIDILEFWGPLNKQDILRIIYTQGYWNGDLRDLILDYHLSIDSNRILPGFAEFRANCRRKCIAGDACLCCNRLANISSNLREKHLLITHKIDN